MTENVAGRDASANARIASTLPWTCSTACQPTRSRPERYRRHRHLHAEELGGFERALCQRSWPRKIPLVVDHRHQVEAV
ncbi:hypothetical protein GS887_28125 [Rhodococcus hoagii]|nr:hypothetical protein [Prescottella equi]